MSMGGTTDGAALSELREALRSACEVAGDDPWANGVDDDNADDVDDVDDIDNVDDVEFVESTEEGMAEMAGDDEEGEGKGGVVGVEAEDDNKVEIGERERARMADLKTALKAGIF